MGSPERDEVKYTINFEGGDAIVYGRGNFCGISIENGRLDIFLPKIYQTSFVDWGKASNLQIVFPLILNSIHKYFITLLRKGRLDIASGKSDKLADIVTSDFIRNCIHLTEMAEQYDLLRPDRVHAKALHSGKIDMKLSLRRNLAVDNHGTVFLNKLEMRKQTRLNGIAAIIVQQAVVEAHLHLENIGLIGQSFASKFSQRIHLSTIERINCLRLVLEHPQSDENRSLIEAVIRFLRSASHRYQKIVFGCYNFHYVWQEALRLSMQTDNELCSKLIQSGLLKGVYNFPPDMGFIHTDSGEPDFLVSDSTSDKIAVVDAKYYDVSSRRLPGWPDMIKQYEYMRAAKLRYKRNEIHGIFVFPSGEFDGEMRFIGTLKPYSIAPLEPIKCFQVPLTLVLQAYIKGTLRSEWTSSLFVTY